MSATDKVSGHIDVPLKIGGTVQEHPVWKILILPLVKLQHPDHDFEYSDVALINEMPEGYRVTLSLVDPSDDRWISNIRYWEKIKATSKAAVEGDFENLPMAITRIERFIADRKGDFMESDHTIVYFRQHAVNNLQRMKATEIVGRRWAQKHGN